MIRYKCNKCGADMESPDGMIGKMEKCPVCKRRMKVKDPAVVAEEERRKRMATEKDIASLRELGFEVPDEVTKEDSHRLYAIWELRRRGVKVDDRTPAEEVDRLSRIVRVQKQGVFNVSDFGSRMVGMLSHRRLSAE